MAHKEELISSLFKTIKLSWQRHEAARRKGDLDKMKSEFAVIVKLARILCRKGYSERVAKLLKDEGMPVQAIMKKTRN